jgi:hypothetical protein
MLRRIHFDRQLPHPPEFLFRRNRNSKGSVGTVGAPVFAGISQVSMPQDHGNRLALEIAWQNRFLLTMFPKRIVGAFHRKRLASE